jgi:hypothetical protein
MGVIWLFASLTNPEHVACAYRDATDEVEYAQDSEMECDKSPKALPDTMEFRPTRQIEGTSQSIRQFGAHHSFNCADPTEGLKML